jgi:copper oxidase (laccase) domain-containing protein
MKKLNISGKYWQIILVLNGKIYVFQKQEHSDNIQVIDNSNIEEINLSDGMITNLKQVILNVNGC